MPLRERGVQNPSLQTPSETELDTFARCPGLCGPADLRVLLEERLIEADPSSPHGYRMTALGAARHAKERRR